MPRAHAHSLYIGVFLPSLPSPRAQDVDFLAVAGEGSGRICLHLSFTRLHRWGSFARACSRRWRQWRQNASLLCSDARARAVLLGRREGAGSTKELAPTTSEIVFSTSEVNPTISDVNPFLLRRPVNVCRFQRLSHWTLTSIVGHLLKSC